MLSLSRLPWMNLRGYPVRTGTLVFFSMLMTMTIFGGTLLVQGIEHGLRTTQSRLGADIMVTPDEADTDFDAQTFLVNAEPSYFYMDASTRDAVAAVDGVEAASSQLFLASARLPSPTNGRVIAARHTPASAPAACSTADSPSMTRLMMDRDAPIERHTASSCIRSFMRLTCTMTRAPSNTSQVAPRTPIATPRCARIPDAAPERASAARTALTLRT